MAMGTVTTSYQDHRSVNRISFAWSSNASGDASGTTLALTGQILGIITVPSATAKPTKDYDLYLKGPKDLTCKFDAFNGLGLNRSSATTEAFSPTMNTGTYRTQAMPVDGTYTLVVDNAGATKSGTVIMFLR